MSRILTFWLKQFSAGFKQIFEISLSNFNSLSIGTPKSFIYINTFPYFIFAYSGSYLQDLTNGIRHIHMYAFFYWHTHDFRHTYVDVDAHFFPTIF